MLSAAACAPPSLRNAHSLDKGQVSVALSGAIDQTELEAEFYTLEDNQTATSAGPVPDNLDGDITVSFGLGKGFEVGATTFGTHFKYSALDERRHAKAPLSIALAVELGYGYAGSGLLLSRHFDMGGIGIRPVANVWYQVNSTSRAWALPESSVVEELEVVNPGAAGETEDDRVSGVLNATVDITEIALPLGIEVPIAVSDKWDVVPFGAYALSVPVNVSYRRLSCADCFAGLGDIALQRRSFVWAGIKLQPTLRRPGDLPATPSSSETEEQP
jgi:hypothetical protein